MVADFIKKIKKFLKREMPLILLAVAFFSIVYGMYIDSVFLLLFALVCSIASVVLDYRKRRNIRM